MEKIEVKKILLVVFVGFMVTLVPIILLTISVSLPTTDILGTAQKNRQTQEIARIKEEVQLLTTDYAAKYYEAKYTSNTSSTNFDIAEYVSNKINGENTYGGTKVTTNNREITAQKDDTVICGRINDKGMIDWNEGSMTEMNNSSNTQENVSFNIIFEAYKGKKNGSQVKLLITSVECSNEIYDDKKIEIKYLENIYNENQFTKLNGIIDDNSNYTVDLNYDSNGIVNLIEINKL